MSYLLSALLLSVAVAQTPSAAPPSEPPAPEAPPPAGEPPAPSLLVLGLEPAGVTPDEAKILDGMIANALTRHDEIEVVTADELAQMMELEGQRQSVGCNNTSCLGEIAGAMGARYVIFGKAGRLGDLFVVQLNLFDSSEAKAVGRQEFQATMLQDLAPQVQPAVDALVAQVTGAPLPIASAGGAPPSFPGPVFLTGAGVAGGGALVAAGGGVVFALFLAQLADPDSTKAEKNVAATGAPVALGAGGLGGAVLVAGAITAAVALGVE